MMKPSLIALSLSLALPHLPACGDDSTPAATDTLEADTSDTLGADAADTREADTAEADTADAAIGDDTPDDISNCEYFENPVFLKCGLAHEQVLEWTAVGVAEGASCPVYFSRQGREYATLEALATAEQCETTCVYKATIAVDFIRCDGQGRSGFEVFADETEGCLEALYRTADGVFTDLCLWPTYLCHCQPE